MARCKHTARKRVPETRAMRFRRRFYDSRVEGDVSVGEHIAKLLHCWTEAGGAGGIIIGVQACLHMIRTLPEEWAVRARLVYRDEIVYSAVDGTPIIDFGRVARHLLELWSRPVLPTTPERGPYDASSDDEDPVEEGEEESEEEEDIEGEEEPEEIEEDPEEYPDEGTPENKALGFQGPPSPPAAVV